MTGKQSAVLWMGLLLVILRMFSSGQWQLFWKTVSSPTSSGSATTTSAHSSAENGATGSVTLV